jgi:aspartate carbamoyltransferase catalytic subunit
MKVDMVVMRHANPGAALLSKNVKASINAGDGAHEHPTQVTR